MRQPVLLHVDDEEDYISSLAFPLRAAGYELLGAVSVAQARRLVNEHFVDLLLVDEFIGRESGTDFLAEIRSTQPGLGAIVISGHADFELAVKAMDVGAVSILPKKPVANEVLLAKIKTALDVSSIAREARFHRWFATREAAFPEIIGRSPSMLSVIETIRRVAPTNATVLIQGEPGTGKELVAQALHFASARRHCPLRSFNIGAIQPTLIESELFGHVKGAFTGADKDRKGHFDAADGGTLFLDEIGDAPLDVQVRLLRALEEREITPVGASVTHKVDIRLVAATNQNLAEAIEAKTFREDLFYRLQVVQIMLPPLRDRLEDLDMLAAHLLARESRSQGKQIDGFEPEAMQALRSYRWPGNIRELRNVIESAVIHTDSRVITSANIRIQPRPARQPAFGDMLDQPLRAARLDFERHYFNRLQERSENKTQAAESAEIHRSVLDDHIKKLEIKWRRH